MPSTIAEFGSNGHTFYVGSLTEPSLGQILVGDLQTGTYSELVPPTGRFAVRAIVTTLR